MTYTDDLLLLAAQALAALVREEFPTKYSLSEIASKWTPPGVTEEQVEALRRVEASWVLG